MKQVKSTATMRSALLSFVCLSCAANASPFVVDGQFDEWKPDHAVAVDPAGDATGAFDITSVSLRSDGPIVFARFDTGRTLNLQSGNETEGTIQFRFMCPRNSGEVLVDTRNRTVNLTVPGNDPRETNWHEVGYWSAPTYAASEFEFRIDLTTIGVEIGDTVLFTLDGSDTLDTPIEFRISDPATSSRPTAFKLPEPKQNQLRVVSLNTWRNGIVHPDRADALLRLLKAPSPDIVLLQEEYNTSTADVEAAIERSLGGDWNTVKVRDNVISTRLPLTRIASLNDSYAAAIVEPEDGQPRLILCVHPKCCGHIGSEEDRRRIEETRAMMQTISLARQRYGDDLPILLAGDWNLVGSRSPLNLLTSPAGSNLRHLEARNPVTSNTYTWFAPDSAFGPGMLDLVAINASAAETSQAFILDTETIDQRSLGEIGLLSTDSRASDHLMLVIDFGI